MKKPATKSLSAERRMQRGRRADDQLPDFKELTENAVQGILVHRNFKPLYANQAFAKLFGYKAPKDILAMPLLRPLVPDDLWARAEQDYDDLTKGRETSAVGRMRALRKDKKEIWLAITQRAIDWHGTTAVQVSALDITAQMAAEQSLLHSEQHMRAMLEILPYPIYIARRGDGQLLFVNRKTCLLFKRSARQMLRDTSDALFVDPKERDDLRKLLDTLSDIRDVEVKMKTSEGKPFTAEMAAIAMDYGGTPAVVVALNDISQRKELEAELLHQASTDSLTGVGNRRYFLGQAEQEMRRSRRFARDLSVMMIDLDHFKSINDERGHAAGDAVLQGVVRRTLESFRQSDQLGRLGGEEFGVILPETSLAAAVEVAERVRKHICERPFIGVGAAIPCTVSIGVAQLSAQDGDVEALFHRADEALYRAKNGGRNKVETDQR